MRQINKIIVHCTDTLLNTSVKSIRNYHLQLGYKEIGYHYLIDRYGFIHKGRSLNQVGAHCKGHNKDSIGIALIGGQFGKFDFTKEQFFAMINLVYNLCDKYQLSTTDIFGHNDFTKYKTCPNFNVKNFFAYEGK